MRLRHPGLLLVCTVMALAPAAGAGPARAPAAGEVTVVQHGGGAELRVRGRPVIRLAGPGAAPRLRAAAARLEPLLPPPTTIRTRVTRWSGQLLVDEKAVLTVTRAEVARLGSHSALVAQWARALEEALTVPPMAVSRTALVLSVGRSERVMIATAGTAAITVGTYDRAVVDVAMQPGGAVLTGKSLGSTVVPFRVGPYRAQVAVSVRPAAGHIPGEAEVVVTGAPAAPEVIREAIVRRLDAAIQREAGATLRYHTIAVEGPLQAGHVATIPVAVGIRSPYGGPVDATVLVRVVNMPVVLVDPEVLLVSNRPEKITDNGVLFRETLGPGKAARLLYHHLNGTPGQTRVLKVTLHNPGSVRARVHYLAGVAGPSADPIHIGFASTQRFLDALTSGRGYMVEVRPGGITTFTVHTLPPLALASGLMQVQVIEGGPVDLVVHVRVPWLLDTTVMTDLGPYAFPHPRGTFPGSVVDVARELPVHQVSAVTDLGIASGLRDLRTGEALVGDYGVLYRLRLRLTNPTDREIAASLVATASGGLARGIFLVDGSSVNAGLMRPFEEREIATFTLGPGGTRDVTVLTMPVAGSYYPVRLSLRPR